jgi:hypothetical protein
MSTDKGKAGMVEIRDVLKNEFQRFAGINTVLKDTSDGLNKIDNTYTHYSSEMDTAKTHILKLKRREFFENMFIYIGLIFFFVCVAYVWLKRFPLHKIVYLVYYLLSGIVNTGISIITSVFGSRGNSSTLNLNSTISELINHVNSSMESFSDLSGMNSTYINNEL